MGIQYYAFAVVALAASGNLQFFGNIYLILTIFFKQIIDDYYSHKPFFQHLLSSAMWVGRATLLEQ